MTEQPTGESSPPATGHRPLVRVREDRIVFGVAAACGRYTDTDPVIWRVGFAVLTVFGGAGLLAYALGWILIPEQDTGASIVDRFLRGRSRPLPARSVLTLVAVGVVVIIIAQQHRGAWLPFLLVGTVVYALLRHHHRDGWSRVAGSGGPVDAASGPGNPSLQAELARRPRSILGRLTASVAAIIAGGLLAMRLAGVQGLTAPRIVAAALLVVGIGLVAGAWYGRARGLIVLGAILALAIPPVGIASEALRYGTGTRVWTPTTASSALSPTYQLGVGEATLDVASVPAGSTGPVVAKVRFGHLIVIIPGDRAVHLVVHVGLGDVRIFGTDQGGSRLDRDLTIGASTAAPLELAIGMGIGQVEVRHG